MGKKEKTLTNANNERLGGRGWLLVRVKGLVFCTLLTFNKVLPMLSRERTAWKDTTTNLWNSSST